LEIKFKKCHEITYTKDILLLLEKTFKDNVYARNTETAFFNGYLSKYTNFVIIENRDKPVAVSIVAIRNIRFFDTIAKAMTIGPFAVKSDWQKKGLGKKLMQGVQDLATKLSIDFLYLVGIKGFYTTFGFESFMQRSKIVIRSEDLPSCPTILVQPYDEHHEKNLKNSFHNLSSLSNYSSIRTSDDWDWLLRHATNSYYFFKPKVILNLHGDFLGYFTHDPVYTGRLRESVYMISDSQIKEFLGGLRRYSESQKLNELEIMTYKNSPLHCFCKKNLNFSFVEFHNKDGGHMLKGLNPSSVKKIKDKGNALPAFIFQGDNL
jgi:predicted N-acetyltransferase YhbS